MDTPLLDLGYWEEITGNNSDYIYNALTLFLNNTPNSLDTLEQLIKEAVKNKHQQIKK